MFAPQRLIFFKILIGSLPLWVSPLPAQTITHNDFAKSIQWLRLLDYEQSFLLKSYQSKNAYTQSFLAPDGQTDPLHELEATIKALSIPENIFEPARMPIGCVFLARKFLIEKNLKIQFPLIECPDFESWKKSIDVSELRIVYAGPYLHNPASLMGHTFFRLANPEKEKQLKGQELLTYTAGYLANTNPNDSTLAYAWKGLTGGYLGVFNIAPYYQNTGLYNNAEARDLWEYPLALTKEELDFFILLLWEKQNSEATPYYFLSQNCSYRPLEVLQTLRPSLELTKELKAIVLPLDTLKILKKHQLIDSSTLRYRPSIKRKHSLLLSQLTPEQKRLYKDLLSSSPESPPPRDPLVLDVAILLLTHKNYKEQTKLSPQDRSRYNHILLARSKIPLTSEELNEKQALKTTTGSPIDGHPSSWFSLGVEHQSHWVPTASFRLGAHSLSSPPTGYEDSTIEYLGVDWGDEKRLLLTSIFSLEEWRPTEPSLSWNLKAEIINFCPKDCLHIQAGLGFFTKEFWKAGIFAMPQIHMQTWKLHDQYQTLVLPGLEIGIVKHFESSHLQIQFGRIEHSITMKLINSNYDGIVFHLKDQQKKLSANTSWIHYY